MCLSAACQTRLGPNKLQARELGISSCGETCFGERSKRQKLRGSRQPCLQVSELAIQLWDPWLQNGSHGTRAKDSSDLLPFRGSRFAVRRRIPILFPSQLPSSIPRSVAYANLHTVPQQHSPAPIILLSVGWEKQQQPILSNSISSIISSCVPI